MSAFDLNLTPSAHGHGEAQGHGSKRTYLLGFVLSAVLTAIPFWLVMAGVLSSVLATALIIFGLAAAQIVVHVVFFLHLDTRSEGGWTLIAFIFTTIIVAIAIAGSVWIMYHLNANMMPLPPGTMPQGM
jgi:cytochrome o ubiquinol oxidase operon protein cyoD